MKSYLKNLDGFINKTILNKKTQIYSDLLKSKNLPEPTILNDTNFRTKVKCYLKNCSEIADTIIQKEIREEWEQRKARLIQLSKDVDFNIHLEKNAKG